MLTWLRSPLVLPLVWIVLHAADFGLTLRGARRFREAAASHLDFGGSYELNPRFEKAIDAGRIPLRFWVSLFGVAALLGIYTGAIRWLQVPGVTWIVDLLIGVLIFTRIGLIAGHLANLWLFNRVSRDPDALQGKLRYARSVTHGVSAARFFTYAALVGASALAEPTSSFLWGGALGLVMTGVWQARLSRRAARVRAAQPQPQG